MKFEGKFGELGPVGFLKLSRLPDVAGDAPMGADVIENKI